MKFKTYLVQEAQLENKALIEFIEAELRARKISKKKHKIEFDSEFDKYQFRIGIYKISVIRDIVYFTAIDSGITIKVTGNLRKIVDRIAPFIIGEEGLGDLSRNMIVSSSEMRKFGL